MNNNGCQVGRCTQQAAFSARLSWPCGHDVWHVLICAEHKAALAPDGHGVAERDSLCETCGTRQFAEMRITQTIGKRA